jgi:hypothetical protein
MGQLREALVAQKISAAVTDMPNRALTVAYHERGTGGSHASSTRTGLYRIDNGFVGALERTGESRCIGPMGGIFSDCLNRNRASNLTRLMPAHTICDDEKRGKRKD